MGQEMAVICFKKTSPKCCCRAVYVSSWSKYVLDPNKLLRTCFFKILKSGNGKNLRKILIRHKLRIKGDDTLVVASSSCVPSEFSSAFFPVGDIKQLKLASSLVTRGKILNDANCFKLLSSVSKSKLCCWRKCYKINFSGFSPDDALAKSTTSDYVHHPKLSGTYKHYLHARMFTSNVLMKLQPVHVWIKGHCTDKVTKLLKQHFDVAGCTWVGSFTSGHFEGHCKALRHRQSMQLHRCTCCLSYDPAIVADVCDFKNIVLCWPFQKEKLSRGLLMPECVICIESCYCNSIVLLPQLKQN